MFTSQTYSSQCWSAPKKKETHVKIIYLPNGPKKRSWCSKKDAFFHLSCRCPIRRSIVRSTGGKHSSSNAAGSALRKHLDEAPCKYLWPEVTLWWGLSTFTTQTYLKTICLHRLSPSKFHQNCKTKKNKISHVLLEQGALLMRSSSSIHWKNLGFPPCRGMLSSTLTGGNMEFPRNEN